MEIQVCLTVNPMLSLTFCNSALFTIIILSLFRLRPPCYGILLPSLPGAVHVLQDGQVVPLVVAPAQSLTRKVSLSLSKINTTILTTDLSWPEERSSSLQFFYVLSLPLP